MIWMRQMTCKRFSSGSSTFNWKSFWRLYPFRCHQSRLALAETGGCPTLIGSSLPVSFPSWICHCGCSGFVRRRLLSTGTRQCGCHLSFQNHNHVSRTSSSCCRKFCYRGLASTEFSVLLIHQRCKCLFHLHCSCTPLVLSGYKPCCGMASILSSRKYLILFTVTRKEG